MSAVTDTEFLDPGTADPSSVQSPPVPGRHHLLDDPGERGRTTVADRVIEAMAAQITREVPEVGGAARRMLGVPVSGEDLDRAPRVEATVAGDIVSLSMRLSVRYPAPVHTVTAEVRRRLVERITELTGKTVRMVDIDVAALHRPARPERVVR